MAGAGQGDQEGRVGLVDGGLGGAGLADDGGIGGIVIGANSPQLEMDVFSRCAFSSIKRVHETLSCHRDIECITDDGCQRAGYAWISWTNRS